MAAETNKDELLLLTTEIVSAHVGNNTVPVSDVPGLVRTVYEALSGLEGEGADIGAERQKPAVPSKDSVTNDHLICLEDGKQLKMLKRHLKTAYNMTPEEYREKWNLPSDYPMVAPSYAERRSKLAKKIGLGTRARRAPSS